MCIRVTKFNGQTTRTKFRHKESQEIDQSRRETFREQKCANFRSDGPARWCAVNTLFDGKAIKWNTNTYSIISANWKLMFSFLSLATDDHRFVQFTWKVEKMVRIKLSSGAPQLKRAFARDDEQTKKRPTSRRLLPTDDSRGINVTIFMVMLGPRSFPALFMCARVTTYFIY